MKSLNQRFRFMLTAILIIVSFQNCAKESGFEEADTTASATHQNSITGTPTPSPTPQTNTLQASASMIHLPENQPTTFELTLNTPLANDLTIVWTIAPAASTTWVAADDFTTVSGTAQILAGQTSAVIGLNPRNNTQQTADKDYVVRIQATAINASLTVPLMLEDDDAAKVFAGYLHACYLKNESLKCWGFNQFGTIGNGTTVQQNAPVQVSGLTSGVKTASVGTHNACAVKNGELLCWGYNGHGQLGGGTVDSAAHPAPVSVPGLSTGVTDVAVGYYTICAIQNGALKCWGYNAFGQVGDGTTTTPKSSPVTLASMNAGVTAVAISEGDDGSAPQHTCAIKNGALYCWGYNAQGQLGDGTTTNRSTPTLVSGMDSGVTAIAVTEYSTCAVKSSELYCWGNNAQGQLGLGDTANRSAPNKVTTFSGKNIQQVTAGKHHLCAAVDSKTYCWGINNINQIGIGTTVNTVTPALLISLDNSVTSIAAGTNSSYAIKNNKLYAWGENDQGQLGTGTGGANTANVTTPMEVLDLNL